MLLLGQALLDGARTAPELASALRLGSFKSASFGQVKFDAWGGIDAGEFLIRARP